jgi:FdhD protein
VDDLDDPRGRAAVSVTVERLDRAGERTVMEDSLATEEPLEIRLGGDEADPGQAVAIVMRTPGDDFDLAWGLAVTEGLVGGAGDITSAHWGAPADGNAVQLRLREGVSHRAEQARPWLVSSACGLCGKDSIEAVTRPLPKLDSALRVRGSMLLQLPERLLALQRGFHRTGGLHAAGAFAPEGEAVCAREDVGRHNAVDKVVGHLARNSSLPASRLVLVVSGRAGFEIVQKAVMAGFGALVSVSAPSSLAVQLAREADLTLAGFVRDGRANIYGGGHRVMD